MSDATCSWASSWDAQIAYASGDLDGAEQDRFEAHVFGCDACAAKLELTAVLVTRLRAMARTGSICWVIAPRLLERFKQSGLKVQEEVAEPGGGLKVPLRRETDLMVGHLRGDFRGRQLVDVEFHMGSLGVQVDKDVPVDRPDEIIIACTRHLLQPTTIGQEDSICRVVAADDPAKPLLGEYRLCVTRVD